VANKEEIMTAYAIFIREKLRDPQVIEVYNSKAGPSLGGHPVKVLAAYGGIQTLEGAPAEGVVLLEFPTLVEAKAWYDGPAYREARELRFKGADYRVIFFEGL
jgi:uncharacterized protein (DUF1330 family)